MPATAVETGAARPRRARAGDVDRHVARRMRERRVMLGLSQHQLAGLIGVTGQQAHKYERGVNRLTAGQLHRIAEALGVGPGYFFEGLGAERTGPTVAERRALDLARNFVALPSRRHREALAELARALSGG